MLTIYQAMTQKQEKDTECKGAADKGTYRLYFTNVSVKSLGMENTGGKLRHTGSFLLLRVATSPSVRSQMRLRQSTTELQSCRARGLLSGSQPRRAANHRQSSDPLPQPVASEVSGKMVAAQERGPMINSCII